MYRPRAGHWPGYARRSTVYDLPPVVASFRRAPSAPTPGSIFQPPRSGGQENNAPALRTRDKPTERRYLKVDFISLPRFVESFYIATISRERGDAKDRRRPWQIREPELKLFPFFFFWVNKDAMDTIRKVSKIYVYCREIAVTLAPTRHRRRRRRRFTKLHSIVWAILNLETKHWAREPEQLIPSSVQ